MNAAINYIMNKKIIISVIVVLVIVGGFLAYRFIAPKLNVGKKNANVSTNKTIANHKKVIAQAINQNITSSKDKGVVDLVNLATSEEDATKSYALYKKAFDGLSKEYSQTKTLKYKYLMIDIKSYAARQPGYNSADFVIPK